MPGVWNVFLTIFLLFSSAIPAQNRQVIHYGVEDGLTSNHVYAAYQDSKGFIWLATTNGVSCFDGKEFKNFTSNNGLPDNDIFNIAEDPAGRLWLSCYNGEPCYINNGMVYTRRNDAELNKIVQTSYFWFSLINNKLLITQGSSKSSYLIDGQGKIVPSPLFSTAYISFGNCLLNGFPVRFGGGSVYYLIDENNVKTDSVYFPNEGINSKEKSSFDNVHLLHDNKILVTNKMRGYLYTVKDKHFYPTDTILLKGNFGRTFVYEGSTWCNLPDNGAIEVDNRLVPKQDSPHLFAGKNIQYFFIDREGNYWACTPGEGVYFAPNNNFIHLHAGNGLSKTNVTNLASRNGKAFLGYVNMVEQLNVNPESESHKNIFLSPNGSRIVDVCSGPGYMAIALHNQIVVTDTALKTMFAYASNNIKFLETSQGSSVLFGKHNGCFLYYFESGIVDTVYNKRSTTAFMRSNGDVLVGSLYGFYNARKNIGRTWKVDTLPVHSVFKNMRISCLGETKDRIIVGTVQNGIALVKGNDFEFIKLGRGFENINCRKMFVEGDRIIWLASFSGIFRIETGASIHSYTVNNISNFNGLASNDVSDLIVVGDSILVASSKGLNIFSKKSWNKSAVETPVVFITEMLINKQPQLLTGKTIELPPGSSPIEFKFSCIDFKSAGNVLFKYRVHGLNTGWQLLPANSARFELLAPGNYTLEVLAQNSHNRWSLIPAVVGFRVLPHWWQTTWFRSLVAILLIASMYLITNRILVKKHAKQIAEAALKKQIIELELSAIKAQINPHFIFNTLNAIQFFINAEQNDKAGIYLERLSGLLRKTLSFSNLSTISLDDEIAYLENYLELEKLRFDTTFSYEIKNSVKCDGRHLHLPPMVLQPHIENALRHGLKNKESGPKNLWLNFEGNENILSCEIRDNGVGRMAAMQNNLQRDESYQSRGTELSGAKLQVFAQLTGRRIDTEIIDIVGEDGESAGGTVVRILIEYKND